MALDGLNILISGLSHVHIYFLGSMQQYPEDMPFGYDGDPQTRMNMQFPNRDNSGRVMYTFSL